MSDGINYEVRLPGAKTILDALVSGKSPAIPRKWDTFVYKDVIYMVTNVEWRYSDDPSFGYTRLSAIVWVSQDWQEIQP